MGRITSTLAHQPLFLEKFEKWGFGNLPVAWRRHSTPSATQEVLGAPVGFTLQVREARLNAGAGFIVVAVCGSMMTMPGLPTRPAAMDMDMDDEGLLIGVFG